MARNIVETLMGAIVILVAISFVMISYKSGAVSNVSGYHLYAKFREVGNLAIGSDVRIGGIKIGVVTGQELDNKTYQARIKLEIKNDVKIPVDSVLSVTSDGLLGGKYLSILPGGEEEYLETGDDIAFTQDAVNLENLLGKFAFGGVSSEKKSEEKPVEKIEINPENSDVVGEPDTKGHF